MSDIIPILAVFILAVLAMGWQDGRLDAMAEMQRNLERE